MRYRKWNQGYLLLIQANMMIYAYSYKSHIMEEGTGQKGENMSIEQGKGEQRNERERQQVVGVSNEMMEQVSLEERVLDSAEMIEQDKNFDDIHNKIRHYNEKTEYLHADEELLKEELKVREKEMLNTYALLMEKKKILLGLIVERFNASSAKVDIGLTEQFETLRKIIATQQVKIEELKGEISRQGIAGVLTDDKEVKMKTKAEQMVKEIKVGRKFSSTQYVRDYLERPQAYKVNYEESKYEFELKFEKKVYEKKKEQINLLKRREREREQELLKEKDYWSK